IISILMNARCFSGINHDDSFIMLNHPDVNGQPLRPFFVKQHVRNSGESCASRLPLGAPHLNETCTNCMNFCQMRFLVGWRAVAPRRRRLDRNCMPRMPGTWIHTAWASSCNSSLGFSDSERQTARSSPAALLVDWRVGISNGAKRDA